MTLNVSLTPQLEELVRQKVSSGRYNSASEVVREALRLMATYESLRTATLAKLKADVEAGWQQVEEGKVRDFDPEDLKRRAREKLKRQQARSGDSDRLSDLADEDLIDIWVGIAPDNEAAADRIVDEIHEVTPMLITYPLLGRAADELRTGARAFVHGNYLVIYRPMDYGSPYYAWHTEPAISRRLEFHRRRTSRPAASPCEATHSAPERT